MHHNEAREGGGVCDCCELQKCCEYSIVKEGGCLESNPIAMGICSCGATTKKCFLVENGGHDDNESWFCGLYGGGA